MYHHFRMRQLVPVFSSIPGPLRVPEIRMKSIRKYNFQVAIEDAAVAPETGMYKVWISNSKAWISSLTIHCHFEVDKAKNTD